MTELARAAQRVTDGDLEFQVNAAQRNEVGTLSRTFNEMIVELRMVPNLRPICKGRRIVEWGLVNRAAIEAWLKANPVPPAAPVNSRQPSLPGMEDAPDGN